MSRWWSAWARRSGRQVSHPVTCRMDGTGDSAGRHTILILVYDASLLISDTAGPSRKVRQIQLREGRHLRMQNMIF